MTARCLRGRIWQRSIDKSELDEARSYADGLRIEPVDDLDQALAVLATVGGGNSVLPPEPTSAAIG